MATKKSVGSYTKAGSPTSTPKAKPQAVSVPSKVAGAKPTQPGGAW